MHVKALFTIIALSGIVQGQLLGDASSAVVGGYVTATSGVESLATFVSGASGSMSSAMSTAMSSASSMAASGAAMSTTASTGALGLGVGTSGVSTSGIVLI
jgi:hypothetical protein